MRDDRVYLFHLRDAARRVLDYTEPGRDAFLSDPMIQDAALRNLEVIGEAAKSLSPGFRDAHAEIPWKLMAGMRDRLIHEYFGVDLELVWQVVARELPEIASKIDSILESGSSP